MLDGRVILSLLREEKTPYHVELQFRLVITFLVRRALPAGIRRSTCSAAEAVYYLEPRDQPAPDPARCFDCPVDPAPAAQ